MFVEQQEDFLVNKEKAKRKGNVKSTGSKTNVPERANAFGSSLARIGVACILVIGWMIYSNTFDSSFHLDDMNNIRDNPVIRDVSDIQAMWEHSKTRFLAFYTFAWNYHFGQLDVWGYHLVNLLIHLVTSVLVYWLTFLLLSTPVLKGKFILKDKTILSLAVALLFVSHPLATQSVTYIVQRMTSMSAMFYFLSLALYLRYRLSDKSKTVKYRLLAGAGVSALLAMLTKENAFTLPFAIVLLEICFLRVRLNTISFKDRRVLFIGGALLGLIAIGFYNYSDVIFKPQFLDPDVADSAITAQNYLLTQFSVIVKYIQLLLVPVNLVFDYDYKLVTSFLDPRAWLSFLALAGLVVLAVYMFKKHRILSFGIFWFFLTLSIESSIIPLQDLIFEHRTYLPSFGYFLVVVYVIYLFTWNKYKTAGLSILGLLIAVNSFLAFNRNKVWKDEVTLTTDTIRKMPNKARPYNNRGDALVDQKKYTEALSDFNKAISINPKYSMAYYNRGTIYEKEKKYEEALADFNTSIRYRHDFDKAYNNRGTIYKLMNRLDEAMADYQQAIELNPSYTMAYNNRGTVHIMQNQLPYAVEDLNKAIELKPDFAEAYANRGIAHMKMGKQQEGCADLKKAADLGFQPAGEYYRQNCQ